MAKHIAEDIDMSKYINSKSIVQQCAGCNKTFTFIHPGTMLTEERCLAYAQPEVKWPGKEKYATHLVTVKSKKGAYTGITKELPIAPKYCPLATHFIADEVVTANSPKVHAGQQKQKKKG